MSVSRMWVACRERELRSTRTWHWPLRHGLPGPRCAAFEASLRGPAKKSPAGTCPCVRASSVASRCVVLAVMEGFAPALRTSVCAAAGHDDSGFDNWGLLGLLGLVGLAGLAGRKRDDKVRTYDDRTGTR